MPPQRPPSSPRTQSGKGRKAPTPTPPIVVRRLEVRKPLNDSDVHTEAKQSTEREQYCLDIASSIADMACGSIAHTYFDSVAADYTAAALWDTMLATLVTSCQDHDRPAHPLDVYEGVPAKSLVAGVSPSPAKKAPARSPRVTGRDSMSMSTSRSAVDASIPLEGGARRGRSPRHVQLALSGGVGGQGDDVVLQVVNSATNWSNPGSSVFGNDPMSPLRGPGGDFSSPESLALAGEGGRWRTDAAPNRIPCDEHGRYVAEMIRKAAPVAPVVSNSPGRRRAGTRIGALVGQVVDASSTMTGTRLFMGASSISPRVSSARRVDSTPPSGAVTRSTSRVAKQPTPSPATTPRPATGPQKRVRKETAKEASDRIKKEEEEAELERLKEERDIEENLPPDVDLDCHRQLTERLRKERAAKDTHDKRLQAVVAGLTAHNITKQPFIVDGSKGLVVGIHSVGDTMQRAMQNSPRFSVERPQDSNEAAVGIATPFTRPATALSSGWSARGGTPRTNTKRKQKSAEDRLKEFVEPQTFKPMEINVEPVGGVTHVDEGGTVKKAEMRLPPGKLNQEQYERLARGGGAPTSGWFADSQGGGGDGAKMPGSDAAASKVIPPSTPTHLLSNPRKPQSAQSARSFRR